MAKKSIFQELPVELMEHILRDLALTAGNRHLRYDISQPDHRLIALHRLARTCRRWRALTLPSFFEMTTTSDNEACQRRIAALAEDSRTLARVRMWTFTAFGRTTQTTDYVCPEDANLSKALAKCANLSCISFQQSSAHYGAWALPLYASCALASLSTITRLYSTGLSNDASQLLVISQLIRFLPHLSSVTLQGASALAGSEGPLDWALQLLFQRALSMFRPHSPRHGYRAHDT